MSFKYVLRYGGKNPKYTQILHIWFDYLQFPPPKDKANWEALGGVFTLETRDMVTRFQQRNAIIPKKNRPYGEVTAVEWQQLGREVGFKAFDSRTYKCLWEGKECSPDPFAVIKFLSSIGGYRSNSLSGGINIYAPHFVEMYSEEFGGFFGGTLYGLGAFLDFMRTDANLTDVRQVAYMMGTVHHETGGTWQPVEETNGSNKWYGKPATVECGGKKYTNSYYGRGYVQLTRTSDDKHKPNGGLYHDVSIKLGMGCELVANPDKAKEPEIAYKILSNGMKEGWYIPNQKLSDYIHDRVCDYYNARNIVNTAHDKAPEIEGYAKIFEAMLRATMFR